MGYWWILYGYLIGMAVSGRLAYWWYTLAAKRVNKKIKAENGVTRLAAPPAPEKFSLIVASIFGPIVIPLALLIPTLDWALYLFILAPLGVKDWMSHYKFFKKARKYDLPWWAGWLASEEPQWRDGDTYGHHYNFRNSMPEVLNVRDSQSK